MNPAVTQLSLYDVANVKGVAADVSHINSRAKVEVSVCCCFLLGPTPAISTV
jgi:malate/lactate dehydrogenase